MRDGAALAIFMKQLADRHVARKSKALALQTGDEACRADALAERKSARGEQAAREAQRFRKPQPAEGEAARIADLERNAQYGGLRDADRAHQAEELGVGTDQDVLSVIELVALRLNAPGASTRNRGRLEDGHRHAAPGERHGGRHAGIAGTNDCYAAT